MKKNRLLTGAAYVAMAAEIVVYLALVISTIVFFHWHVEKEHYDSFGIMLKNGDIELSEGKEINANSSPASNYTSEDKKEKVFRLSDLSRTSFYFTSFQIILSLVLIVLMLRKVRDILRSVKEFKTFTNTNVKSFKRLGDYCLALGALNCIYFLASDTEKDVSFNPSLTLLSFMLAAFILAEIFKEGQKLAETEQLTI